METSIRLAPLVAALGRPSNTEISGEAPAGPCFVRCISLLGGRVTIATTRRAVIFVGDGSR
jgi:hypothetical protein